MKGFRLERRVYRIGGVPGLAVHGDCGESFGAVGLMPEDGDYQPLSPGTAELFMLGGRAAGDARIAPPSDACVLFETKDVVIRSRGSLRYGEWYGKARSVADIEAATAVIALPGLRRFNPEFIARLIVRPVLDRLLSAAGHIPLHAAGVVAGAMGYVIAGVTGSGKSTLLAGLVGEGMGFLADDRLLLSRDDTGEVCLFGIPETIRLARTERGPKHSVTPPNQNTGRARPGIIFLLDRPEGPGKASCVPVSPSEASARLMQCLPPFTEKAVCEAAFHGIADMCGSARSFRLTGSGSPSERLGTVLNIIRCVS